MSSTSHDGHDGEPPRKRVRKGTRSCWECKRRKIKCQLSSEDVPVCSGCLARGSTCLSQEYPEERESSGGPQQVGERLGRMEHMLETLLAKVNEMEDDENNQKTMLTPDSMGNDVLTPFSAGATTASAAQDSPFLTLFDNEVIRRGGNAPAQMPTPASNQSGGRTTCRVPKLERIRQALVDLLPSQKDTNLINERSSSWLLINALVAQGDVSVNESTFNVAEVAMRHPTSIARTLLYLAVCLQQLDPDFDSNQLHLYPTPEARMERYITTVQALVTSDDEMVSTMDGLECLSLLGLYQINAGNPRRAWLTFRRALNISQLMGLQTKKGASIPGGKEMWHQIIQADRYLALLLGLPCGSADGGFAPHENFQNPDIDTDDIFVRKLCDVSGRLIERNQIDHSHAYAATQEIDEQLEKLAAEMPASWWEIPKLATRERTKDVAMQFDRIMTQIWFFQLESLLHLPFMLRAATERRYDYSKFSCLEASREMMVRYLALRRAGNSSFCCKVVDFGALTATVTLFLGILDSTATETHEQKLQKEADRRMIQEVLESMSELSHGGKDIVASQSVNVIKSLLAVDSPSGSSNTSLKLTIPYFGTISIVRPQTQTPKLDPRTSQPYPPPHVPLQIGQEPPTQSWQGISAFTASPVSAMGDNVVTQPMVQFTSSQFAPLVPEQTPIQDWGLTEADTLFFDSLLNTDIEGNWIF